MIEWFRRILFWRPWRKERRMSTLEASLFLDDDPCEYRQQITFNEDPL